MQETQDRFAKLPSEIKKLLYSQEMSIIIQKIGEKNQLHIDQTDALNTETGQVMLGFSNMEEFIEDIRDTLSVDQTKATAIAQDVNDMLFVKIREAMKNAGPVSNTTEQNTSERMPLSQVLPKTVPVSEPVTPLVPEVKPSFTPMVVQPAPSAPAMSAPVAPAAPKVDMHPADVALTQKTVSVAPAAPAAATPAPAQNSIEQKAVPPKPQDYKADPYREPVN